MATPSPAREPVVGVKRRYLNLGSTLVRGADLDLNYRVKFDNGSQPQHQSLPGLCEGLSCSSVRRAAPRSIWRTLPSTTTRRYKARLSAAATRLTRR